MEVDKSLPHLNEAGMAVLSRGGVLPQGLKAWITWKRCLDKGASLHPVLSPKSLFYARARIPGNTRENKR